MCNQCLAHSKCFFYRYLGSSAGSESELIEFVGFGSEAIPASQPREPMCTPSQPKVTLVHKSIPEHPSSHVTQPDEGGRGLLLSPFHTQRARGQTDRESDLFKVTG